MVLKKEGSTLSLHCQICFSPNEIDNSSLPLLSKTIKKKSHPKLKKQIEVKHGKNNGLFVIKDFGRKVFNIRLK